MTHRHKWRRPRYEDDGHSCECSVVMWEEEVLRRLNATECLSAEDARTSVDAINELAEVAREVGLLDVRYVVKDDDSLLQYARALEENDEI